MPCDCLEYQCLSVDIDDCSSGVELPINADETGDWVVLIEFNGVWNRFLISVTDEQPIIIPNVLNEVYTHTIRLLNTAKELYNDTCYKIKTHTISGSAVLPDTPDGFKETYRIDIEVTDTTSQVFLSLIGSELLEVWVENEDLMPFATLNSVNGVVTWNYAVGVGQTGYILYKK